MGLGEFIKSQKEGDSARRLNNDLLNSEIAQLVLQARTEAGLSQAELAERVGTSQSAIGRLENENYSGHSVAVLRKVGDALGRRLRVSWDDRQKTVAPIEQTFNFDIVNVGTQDTLVKHP